MIKKVCVYCASSQSCDKEYFEAANELGIQLSQNNYEVMYGGGAVGLMGQLANSVISANGKITGILPKFMFENGWGHKGINELKIVDDMHQRTKTMLIDSDAFIVLPGGCGTFHELMEALTWKRLGLMTKPIIILNTKNFYAPLFEILENSITEKFMDRQHEKMWVVANNIDEVMFVLKNPPAWKENALDFANVK